MQVIRNGRDYVVLKATRTAEGIKWVFYTRPKLFILNTIENVKAGGRWVKKCAVNAGKTFVYVFYTAPRNGLIRGGKALKFGLYTKPKELIIAGGKWTKRTVFKIGAGLKYAFYTKPTECLIATGVWIKQSAIRTGKGIKYVAYTKPRECVIQAGIWTKNAAVSTAKAVKYATYDKPKECIVFAGAKTKEGCIKCCEGLKYGLYDKPKECVLYGYEKTRTGLIHTGQAVKYGLYTKPKECIGNGYAGAVAAAKNTNVFVRNKAYAFKEAAYTRPKENIIYGYHRSKTAVQNFGHAAYETAGYVKHNAYTRPKEFSVETAHAAAAGARWSWEYASRKALDSKQYAYDTKIKVKNLPIHQKILLGFGLLGMLMVMSVFGLILYDVFYGDYVRASHKTAQIFALANKGLGLLQKAFNFVMYIAGIIAHEIWLGLCYIMHYIWLGICYVMEVLWIILTYKLQWLLAILAYFYNLLRSLVVLINFIVRAINTVLDRYNKYRDGIFLFITSVMTLYCIGLTRDRLDSEREYEMYQSLMPGIDEVDLPEYEPELSDGEEQASFEADDTEQRAYDTKQPLEGRSVSFPRKASSTLPEIEEEENESETNEEGKKEGEINEMKTDKQHTEKETSLLVDKPETTKEVKEKEPTLDKKMSSTFTDIQSSKLQPTAFVSTVIEKPSLLEHSQVSTFLPDIINDTFGAIGDQDSKGPSEKHNEDLEQPDEHSKHSEKIEQSEQKAINALDELNAFLTEQNVSSGDAIVDDQSDVQVMDGSQYILGNQSDLPVQCSDMQEFDVPNTNQEMDHEHTNAAENQDGGSPGRSSADEQEVEFFEEWTEEVKVVHLPSADDSCDSGFSYASESSHNA